MPTYKCPICLCAVRDDDDAAYCQSTRRWYHQVCIAGACEYSECSRCHDWMRDDKDLHYLAVVGRAPAGGRIRPMPRGIYRIIAFPFYTSNYFETWLRPSALRRVVGIGAIVENDWPVELWCDDCAERQIARDATTTAPLSLPHGLADTP